MNSLRRLVLATRNPGKILEIRQALADLPIQTVCVAELGDFEEPAEDADSFLANARGKALGYARMTGEWCLADDSGLEVDALGGAPGVRSARYAAADCPADADRATIDQANNRKLLAEISIVPDERRTARFVCQLAMADARRVIIEASGKIEGRIIREPRGDNGFGYDPLFYIPQLGCTTAELPLDRKNVVSHRGQAVRRFAELLGQLLARGEA